MSRSAHARYRAPAAARELVRRVPALRREVEALLDDIEPGPLDARRLGAYRRRRRIRPSAASGELAAPGRSERAARRLR